MTSIFRRWRDDRKGNVAMIIALSTLPVVGTIGLAVDSGAALRRQERLQAAVDSGVLAGLKAMPDQDDEGVTQAADRYITTNFGGLPYTLTEVNIDRTAQRVEIKASSPSRTVFGGIFGITYMNVDAEAVATGGGTIELVMTLDNSGSMASAGRIQALREASTDLVDTLMDDATLAGRIKIGVVPFSAHVNVGPGNATARWMDRSGRSPLHGENFTPRTTNRFTVYKRLGVDWAGCVDSRTTQNDLDVSDAEPNPGDGRTLFVPNFAPDEPDTQISGSYYYNTYLNDNAGTCGAGDQDGTDAQRQSRRCKYDGQAARTTHSQYGIAVGPNQMCNSVAILPLSDDKDVVTAKLNSMQPRGNTNIVEGAAWGWRVLSNSAPFTEGEAYNTTGNRKILIVMTDGENTISGNSRNFNLALYHSAYGYPSKGHLISPSTSDDTALRNAMNDRLRLACSNAKAADVEIFSIIVSAPNDVSRQVMEDCATQGGPDQHAFSVETAGELGDVFEQIGKSIKQVRLAE